MSKEQLIAVELNTKEDFENYNFREKLKKAQRPYDYYKDIKSLDYEQLAESDRFFLQDFGIYNNSLEDEDFMLRLRFPAGRITNQELKVITQLVEKYNLDVILTARAGVQLHGLEAQNILDAYETLKDADINTWQSFGDNVRNITTDVFDGISTQNIIEVYPLIMQMQEYILKNPEFVGLLPRRLSFGISGSYANGGSFFASDIYFALARKKNKFGFNVYLGGKNTELAQNANIFLEEDEVVEFFVACVKAFNEHGLRLDRERNRLFHLLEEIGIQTFKEYVQNHFQKFYVEAGETLLNKIDIEEFTKLKDGKYAFCYKSDFAKLKVNELVKITQFVQEHNLNVRIGTDQQLYIIGLENEEITLEHHNKNRTIVACAGSDFCPYAYWSIKDEVQYLPLDMIEKNNILVGFSGCLKGCAKHEHSDIGLVGLKSNYLGNREKTARIYLGAQYTHGTALARRVFNTIPLNNLKEILSLIIKEYENSSYENFEEFSLNVLNKYSIEFLNLWFLAKFKTKKEVYLDESFEEKNLLVKNFEDINTDDFKSSIEELSKQLWKYKESEEDKKLNATYIMDHN